MPPKRPDQVGDWAAVYVEPHVPWPENNYYVEFRAYGIWLLPGDHDHYPAVTIDCGTAKISFDEGLTLLRHFLTSLAWAEGRGIRIAGHGGGTVPYRFGRGRNVVLRASDFRVDYLPDPSDARARLALALFREASSLENIAYSFLGYFKVLNVVHRKSKDQITWINANIGSLHDRQAQERLVALKGKHGDIGNYLYSSGRCAVAHAFSSPVVDPDDIQDDNRLQSDMPLIRALAERAIEDELGVKTSHTIWKEHLYELEGFRILFGKELVRRLKNKSAMAKKEIPKVPKLSIRLADHEPFFGLESLTCKIVEIRDGAILYTCTSQEGVAQTLLCLNFPEERLQIDLEGGFAVFDNGTPEAADYAAGIMRFRAHYLANGMLEVWDAENNARLGRVDAYIPVNVDLTASFRNMIRLAEQFAEQAEERRGKKER